MARDYDDRKDVTRDLVMRLTHVAKHLKVSAEVPRMMCTNYDKSYKLHGGF